MSWSQEGWIIEGALDIVIDQHLIAKQIASKATSILKSLSMHIIPGDF